MKYLRINSNKNKEKIQSGAFGSFFAFKRYGIKVIESGGFKTLKACIKSYDFKLALKESTYLKISEASNLSPKFHEILVVKTNGKYFPAIKMEKITGKSLSNYRGEPREFIKVNKRGKVSGKKSTGPTINSFIKKQLKKSKIIHSDLHGRNIIVSRDRKPRIIDFGPNGVFYIGKAKDYMKVYKTIEYNFLKKINVSK